MRAFAALGNGVDLGVYSLASAGLYGTVVGGQLELRPDLEGLSVLKLGTEYGLQLGTGAGGLRLGGEVRREDAALAATWQQAAAGFQGAPDDGYSFDLSGSLRLGGASATYLSTKVGQKERYPPGGLLSALPLRFERSGSGRVATAAGGLGWSLQYEVAEGFDAVKPSAQTTRQLTFGVSSPLAENIVLTQDLSWLREVGVTANDEALGYEVRAFVPSERGSFPLERAGRTAWGSPGSGRSRWVSAGRA